MRPIEPPFFIESNGKQIKVSEHLVASERVFYLEFLNEGKPLKLIVAERRPSGEKFLDFRAGRSAGGSGTIRQVNC